MNLDTTLERCLQQIEAGESIDACLAGYPDQAAELAPMLAAAIQVRLQAGARLSQTQRLQAKATLRQTLAAQPRDARKASRIGWMLPLGGARRLATVAATALLLVIVLSAGVVARSEPGNPAYALRVVAERAPALVNPSAVARTSAELTVADRRLADLQSHLERAGRLEPAALRALLAGDEAAARHAARAGGAERLRVARRLATHARLLQALALRARDDRTAQMLNEASQRTLALIARLRATPPDQSPGNQLPEDDLPAPASDTATPTISATSTATAAATATATPTATATATPAATATASATASSTPAPGNAAQPAPTVPKPDAGTPPKPSVEPTQTEPTVPPRPPRPRQTALAQTATARAETATARAATATARASSTPRPPRPRQTAMALTATAMAQTATPEASATPTPDQTPGTPAGPTAAPTPEPMPTKTRAPVPPPPNPWRPKPLR